MVALYSKRTQLLSGTFIENEKFEIYRKKGRKDDAGNV